MLHPSGQGDTGGHQGHRRSYAHLSQWPIPQQKPREIATCRRLQDEVLQNTPALQLS